MSTDGAINTAAKIDVLYAELRARQQRLGTELERPDDHVRVCEVAHALNNLLTAATLTLEGLQSDSPINPS